MKPWIATRPRERQAVETKLPTHVWLPAELRPHFDAPGAPDPLLLWPTLLLVGWGLVMVYSASIAVAAEQYGTPYFFLIRQLFFVAIGMGVAWWTYRLPLRWWEKNSHWLFVASLVLLILVLIPGIGKTVNGARRWIALGPLNLQPAEIVKFTIALFASHYTVRRFHAMQSFFAGFLPFLVVVAGVGSLLLLQPDFGSLVVMSVVAFGILFMGGLSWRIVGLLAAAAIFVFAALVVVSPYRMQRFVAFLDPWSDPLGKGYQLTHALIAFGRGEWLGVGLGGSIEKLFYLPEAHTDFILAVIGEELGWAGVVTVALLFGILVWRMVEVGRRLVHVEAYFPGLAVIGVALGIGVQAVINMGVNVGLLPTKGLALPFMSYGGSALVMNLLAVAFVMRAEWELRSLCRRNPV
ncbi:putative lipid II flippase FtsW [Hydrogenophilus thiooxidans]|uniref:putative lipid II flippase FtsW n=1 Tax=Hydrogenophilus thiooxidans TaxID=2820326 RepID=UPI001C240017|nr:putative lipid II flippase FtsW [Hydrogenophilus thiooxidans]